MDKRSLDGATQDFINSHINRLKETSSSEATAMIGIAIALLSLQVSRLAHALEERNKKIPEDRMGLA